MELVEALRSRRMVRRYDAHRPLEPDLVDRVLEAAVGAPSAGFTQAVAYQVLTGGDVSGYWETTAGPGPDDAWLRGMRTAPLLVLVWTSRSAYLDRYAEPDKGWTDRNPERWSAPYWYVDAGMGVMAALLRAVDLGLGACFFGVPADRIAAVRRRFEVPADRESVGVLSLGYAAESNRPAPRRARRPPDAVVRRGRWWSGAR